jgi:NitT/TauT family transport system ATP-binding protein
MTDTVLRLGYVPLLDAAPLFVAEALGFAEEEGLQLRLIAAPSWARLRDMLALGQIEAAQMLAPVPVAMALGLGGIAARFDALSVLNMNGDVIGASNPLAERMRAAGYGFDFADAALAGHALLAAAGERLRIGVPFPFSMHAELVHYWFEGLGRPLPAGLEIHTVPPPRMAEALAAGDIDAFCVGEPHGSVAVEKGVGTLLLPGLAIWSFAPEKVLATRTGWAEAEPEIAGRLLRAVWRAGRWLGQAENRMMASELLAAPGRLALPELIERALTGRIVISGQGEERHVPGFVEFFAGAATFPWRSQAAWIGRRLAARYGLDPVASVSRAEAVFRSDLYRLHLRGAGANLPRMSGKPEGAMAAPGSVAAERGALILCRDQFFDAQIFDPEVLAR